MTQQFRDLIETYTKTQLIDFIKSTADLLHLKIDYSTCRIKEENFRKFKLQKNEFSIDGDQKKGFTVDYKNEASFLLINTYNKKNVIWTFNQICESKELIKLIEDALAKEKNGQECQQTISKFSELIYDLVYCKIVNLQIALNRLNYFNGIENFIKKL